MLKPSKSRQSLITAGLLLVFAAAPLGQILAQESSAAMQKSSENQTVPDKVADAWITTKVKSEFGTTKGIPAADISVSTHDGFVTLAGNVSSAKEKFHAMRVAKMVKGVKSVDASGLNIAAEPRSKPMPDMHGH